MCKRISNFKIVILSSCFHFQLRILDYKSFSDLNALEDRDCDYFTLPKYQVHSNHYHTFSLKVSPGQHYWNDPGVVGTAGPTISYRLQ